jgi:DTW domain-containing protein YfiP
MPNTTSLRQPNIILLTHERELQRPTNTGRCVLTALPERTKTIVWQRKEPDSTLLALIEQGNIGLVYPTQEHANDTDVQTASAQECEYWLFLDATWQEARKMFNRSAYLKHLPRIPIHPSAPSLYRLRRNQKPEGLCTAECVIELLKANREPNVAAQLETTFIEFNNTLKANLPQ